MIITRKRSISYLIVGLFLLILPSVSLGQEGVKKGADEVRVRLSDGSVVVAQRVDSGDGSVDYGVSEATGSDSGADAGGGGDGLSESAFVPESSWQWYLFIFGLVAQGIFMSRFVVQWLVSEKAKKSVIPRAFWWLSLAGSTMLFTYFTLRHDPIGMLGQCTGWLIYSRNLYFIYRPHRSV